MSPAAEGGPPGARLSCRSPLSWPGARLSWPGGGSGTGPVLLEAQEAEAVEDDEDRREGHGRPGDHRIQQAQSRDRNRRRVVGEGPEQVALDEAEGSAREPDGLWDLPRIGLDHGDVR